MTTLDLAGLPAPNPRLRNWLPLGLSRPADDPWNGHGGRVLAEELARAAAALARLAPAVVVREFDPDDPSTYSCAQGGGCGCVGTGLLGCPGRIWRDEEDGQ